MLFISSKQIKNQVLTVFLAGISACQFRATVHLNNLEFIGIRYIGIKGSFAYGVFESL